LGRHAEALSECCQLAALDKNPGRPYFHSQLALTLADAKDHARAVAEANAVAQFPSLTAYTLYNLARVYAQAGAAASHDAKLAEPERDKLAGQYAARAVELLKKAEAAGYFQHPDHWADLKKNKDLDPLRGREDFQKLQGRVEGKGKGPGLKK
jgi:hypothetical protein